MSDRMNYRDVLKKNANKTIFVVIMFLILYASVGYIIDILIQWPPLTKTDYRYVGFGGMFNAIADLKIKPYATMIMLVIGFVSVLVTFSMHDKMMMWGAEYKEIDLNSNESSTYSLEERKLYNVVEEMRIAGSLSYMPKVYLIDANYMNAFASGYSEKSAMVAITKGLMEKLNRDELQAVMAHEISHIKHLDIKLTLFVGVLSNIMIIVLDTLMDVFRFTGSSDNDGKSSNQAKMIVFVIIMVMRLIFPMLATMLQLSLSRTREYMADAGAVKMTRDREAMATALLKIHKDYSSNEYEDKGVDIRKAAYIYNPLLPLLGNMFSTHPTIEERIKALGMRKMLADYNKTE